ncbi:MAG TPA: AraC family transcriptional regulator [Lachnospiraceae bacterium]|jgi:AraC-like DNA-binding protein|nr:AraC family transcriptional regulator [Lachnospiraceae bacterium]HCA70759.1 AraC family transcriptional regulator [Lachnospiraceae bacterium]HCM12981.1 AraC family transcriptional regulator [Lachnospiraceae bacterium]
MNSYIFETIEHHKESPAKVIITSIDHSDYHWHYDYELIMVVKGEIILSVLPEFCLMQEGDIALVNSKEVHGFQNNNQENICLIIQIKNEFFDLSDDKNQAYYFYLNSAKEAVKPRISYTHFQRTLAQIGLESGHMKKTSNLRIQGLIYMLISDLFDYIPHDIQQFANEAVQNTDSEEVLKIIRFIEKHLIYDNLTEELCKSIGMSEKGLYRFLKSTIDMTLKELIDVTRLNHAIYLLSYTDKDNSTIASECGFCNDNTFYRCFKKMYGMTPLVYKNNTADDKKPKRIKEVQGYLDYSKREAFQLLKKYVEIEGGLRLDAYAQD